MRGCFGSIIKFFIYSTIWFTWYTLSVTVLVTLSALVTVAVTDAPNDNFITYLVLIVMFISFLLAFYIMTRKWHKKSMERMFSTKFFGIILFTDILILSDKINPDKEKKDFNN